MRRWGVLAGVAVVAAVLFVDLPGAAAADLNNVTVRPVLVATKVKQPTAVAFRAGDPVMYVAEQNTGRVRFIVNGVPAKGKVVKVANSKGGERGLLGIAFSPNGQKLYVDYTDKDGDVNVDEYTMSGRVALKETRRRVLIQEHSQFSNHNGGQVQFGPDNNLYVSIGDGGSGGDPFNNAQNRNTWLGKILRINPTPTAFTGYSWPADNPFVGVPGTKPEVWMYGLRNPWRSSFDMLTGDFWIGDVGQAAYEEIDFIPAAQRNSGANWGWKLREGFHQFSGPAPPGARDPIIERPHSAGDCAIIGGYVYRGTAMPNLVGAYLYSDICTGIVYGAVQSGGVITQSRALTTVSSPTSFGQAPNGDLYVVSRDNAIYKLVP
jgi:glucose/arabinose dehydrogenase